LKRGAGDKGGLGSSGTGGMSADILEAESEVAEHAFGCRPMEGKGGGWG
jgi:hypothetical protein